MGRLGPITAHVCPAASSRHIEHGSGVDFPLNRTHRNPIGSFRFQCGVTLTVEMQRGKSCGRSQSLEVDFLRIDS
ncbi:hypothetical protein OPV22_009538 [Ensete ventricosum]|uniref:Uncharacterized protein n=1 Tax=Ensete ventricosum TaxID=4639 RepID=A0AAV8RIP4_ENSVE|nr:hypothetical protein OPV22_009538 [Ensete ventricosum]